MHQPTTDPLTFAAPTPEAPEDPLTEILREGARKMLAYAIEAEVADWIDAREGLRDEAGHRLVVRNGHQPERTVQTGLGPMPVRKPEWHEAMTQVGLPREVTTTCA